jgi:hypothetical protein
LILYFIFSLHHKENKENSIESIIREETEKEERGALHLIVFIGRLCAAELGERIVKEKMVPDVAELTEGVGGRSWWEEAAAR